MSSNDVKAVLAQLQEARAKMEAEIEPLRQKVREAQANLARIDTVIAAYEGKPEAAEALLADLMPTTRKPRAPRSNGTGAVYEEWAPKVLTYLAEHPGQKVGQISEGVGWTNDNQVFSQKVLKPLREQDKIRGEGPTQKMVYSVA